MAKKIGLDDHIYDLAEIENKIKLYWKDVAEHVRKDIAYVWSDEVKRDFGKIKNEAEKIKFFLERIRGHYAEIYPSFKAQEIKKIYRQRISDIDNLIFHLNKIEPTSKWVNLIHNDLQQIIFDIEREKAEIMAIKSRRRFLATASKVVIGGIFSKMFFPSKAEAKEIKAGLQIIPYYSPLNEKRKERLSTKFIILHTTEANDESSFNSVFNRGLANFLVDTKGNVYETIVRDKIAHHAGLSIWDGIEELNKYSIGIEIAGYHYAPLTEQRYASLRVLIKELQDAYAIPDENVLAHYQVAYDINRYTGWKKARGRKIDGINIDWQKLGIRHRIVDPDVKAGRVKEDPFLSAVLAYEGTYGKPPFDSVTSQDGKISWINTGNEWKRYKKQRNKI